MVKTVSSGNDFPAEVNCVGTVHVTKNNTATVAPAQSITYSGYEGHGNVAARTPTIFWAVPNPLTPISPRPR